MRLTARLARPRLAQHDHGVLGTVHPERGVDTVPVVFAVSGDHLGIPVDVVKPKASTRLQRERNLQADPRASLLIEHWDPTDWSRLWWVRTDLRWEADPDPGTEAALADLLVSRYAQYQATQEGSAPFARVLVFDIVSVSGWSAAG